MGQTLNTILYSTLAGVSTLFGVYLAVRFQNKIKTNILVSFAAGALLAGAFINILPEALELNVQALSYALVAIILFYILEQRIHFHSCHDENCEKHQVTGIMATFGIGFHSLLDGIIIGVGFEASPALGIIATLGVLMHELPEGISIFSILIQSGFEKKKAILRSIIVALATPLGAIFTLIFIENISIDVLGILLAIAAGSFIYVGASDLLPETHRKISPYNVPTVILGALFIYIANILI